MIARVELRQVDVMRQLLNAGLSMLIATSAFVAAFAGTTLAAAATPPLELRGAADLVSRLDAGYAADPEPQQLRRLDPRVIDQAAADERMLGALLSGTSRVATEAAPSLAPSTPASIVAPPVTADAGENTPVPAPSVAIEVPGVGAEATAAGPARTPATDVNAAPVATPVAEKPVVEPRVSPPIPVAEVPPRVVAPVVETVTGGVAPVVETVTGGVAPVVETVTGGVAPVVETVTGGVAPVVETVTGGVAPVVETVTGGLGSVVDNVLGGLLR